MHAIRAILLVAGMACAGAVGSAQEAGPSVLARIDVEASRVADSDEGIVVDLTISQPVPYRIVLLDGPPRLVVDFREVDFGAADAASIDASRQVTGAQWGRFAAGWSRLVAELDGPYLLESAEERTDGGGPAEIRIRLRPASAAEFAAAAGAPADPAWALPRPAVGGEPRPRQVGDRPLFVVLDPGHGGIDPGAEAGGLTEADAVLIFARELAEVLRRGGMDVLLTREADVFVPLEIRISVARAAGADILLSLHADALAEGEATGATIYTLADEASEEAAARLAERHDRDDLLAGVDLSGQDDEIAGVLMDLARAETDPRADRLAAELARAIRDEGLKMHRHPVQAGAFSVLKSPDIPSILLEVGFLSSEADRARLADAGWRARMQRAILAGLQDWAVADAAEARLLRQ